MAQTQTRQQAFGAHGETGQTKQVIFSVKAGHLTVAHLRELLEEGRKPGLPADLRVVPGGYGPGSGAEGQAGARQT